MCTQYPWALWAVWAGLVGSNPPAPTQPVQPSEECLQLLTRYFQAQSSEQRASLAEKIAVLPSADVAAVAGALHRLPLWPPAAPGISSRRLDCGDGTERQVLISAPQAYDPAQPWPLIIALPGTGQHPAGMMDFIRQMLGEEADRRLIACPQAPFPGAFAGHELTESLQPVAVLRQVRRLYHVDGNRVYLLGYSKGGHRACLTAVMFADQFAGTIPIAGCMGLPQREGLYPQFLPNLRHLPMLLCWGELDTRGADGKESTLGGIAGINRRFVEATHEMMLPVTPFAQQGVGHGGVRPPARELGEILAARRAVYPVEVSHWFRFPAQGRAYWLSLAEFLGEPWTGRQLHVQLGPGDDPQEKILQETRRRMGKITGTIQGQLITIHARRIKALDVLLADPMLDLDQPVQIKFNGRRAFDGPVERRVETLLEVAARDWDFDRLFPARVRLTIGRRGRQF